jgi:hypothetical protein
MKASWPQRLLRFSHTQERQLTPSDRRTRTSSLAGGALVCALVPAFELFAPPSQWHPLALLLTLGAIAFFSYLGAVAANRSALFDAGFVAGLLAVVFLGPVPAAWIWIGTEVAALAVERVRTSAFLANVASYGWAALAGSLLFDALTGGSTHASMSFASAVALTGLAMHAVNFTITRGLIAVVRDGKGIVETTIQELVVYSPAIVVMTALGAATALLYTQVGILALALFAVVVVVPQALLPILLRPQPVAALDHAAAVSLYALAIARMLRCDRDTRLILRDAVHYLRDRRLKPRTGELSRFTTEHRLALVEAVLFYREHWDGHGGKPGAVGGDMIPLTSRILAVADAWAGLTAKGSPGLTHAQAMNQLEARAGLHFDPRVVAAAQEVVLEQQLGLGDEVAYQPRMRNIPIPAVVRRMKAADGSPSQ